MRKREGHQSRKYFNQKNKKREREREKWMQEFSSSCERILIRQKTQETWHSMKDHSSWEGWAKHENSSREETPIKLRKMRKRKNTTHFI